MHINLLVYDLFYGEYHDFARSFIGRKKLISYCVFAGSFERRELVACKESHGL